jgi:NAD/NADP transhydrogenase beta subunit
VVAAVLFILDLKWMAHPRTAVRGNTVGALGMLLAIFATFASGALELHYTQPEPRLHRYSQSPVLPPTTH